MAKGFVSDMLPKSRYLEAPTIAKNSNEITDGIEMGNLKPTAVDENNNDSVEPANTILKPNNILGIRLLEEKQARYYQWADKFDVWNNDSYTHRTGVEMRGFHTFIRDTGIFNLTKTKHKGKSKARIVSEESTSNKSDFYIKERQS